MKSRLAKGFSLAVFALLLATASCRFGPDLELQGDTSAMIGRHREAVGYYESAMLRSPRLIRSDEFKQKLQQSRFEDALETAAAAAGRQEWDPALDACRQALVLQPGQARALTLQQQTARAAAVWWLGEAVRLADAEKMKDAEAAARKAWRFDPAQSQVLDALQSMTAAITEAPDYQQALAGGQDGHWPEQAAALEIFLTRNPFHLPAHAARTAARQRVAAAEVLARQADGELQEKHLDNAAALAGQALASWPFCPAALEIQAAATRQKTEYERLLRLVEEQAAKSDWKMAVSAARAAEAAWPDHLDAKNLARRTAARAADFHGVAAARELKDGHPGEAEIRYRVALEFVPGSTAALLGLADTAGARAETAAKARQPGLELLWLLEADAMAPGSFRLRWDKAVAAAKARLAERGAFTLAVDGGNGAGGAQGVLAARITALLNQKLPPHIRLLDPAAKRPPLFVAAVRTGEPGVTTVRDAAEEKVFTYSRYEDVPNPECAVLEDRLRRAQRELDTSVSIASIRCHVCGGSGRGVCSACQGRGVVPCAACGGKGQLDNPRSGVRNPCATCQGKGQVPCKACRNGQASCRACGGSGRENPHAVEALQHNRLEVESLESRLRREPLLVRITVPTPWPYRIEHYRKTGALNGTVVLTRTDTGVITGTIPVTAAFSQEDTATVNANPAIGLREDPLFLDDDGTVCQRLLETAAGEAANNLLRAVIRNRAGEFQAAAEAVAGNRDPGPERELRVLAAVLLETADPAPAAARLRELRTALDHR